jgi:hypothetical protein
MNAFRTRHQHDELDPALELAVEELRRRVAWQVATAYGLPLEEPRRAQSEPVPLPLPLPPAPEEPDLPPAAAATPEPVPPAPPAFPMPTLDELERLVSLGAELQPERVEEWRWYLFYLRGFADVDGALPDAFRLLLETVFGPLLASVEPVHVGV